MGSPLGIPGVQEPDEIGRGGFGTVYRAEEPEFGRSVAVKVIQDRLDDDEVRRAFARECQAMGRLSGHPHIVSVHRGGTTDAGSPYIVMDLMDGGSLADRLRREGPLTWPEVLDIGVAVAGALETAHRAGILHLDVKPANVLVSRFGEPKLADFGISRLPGVTATTDGRVRASIAYAAPERLLDGTATPSADLYSLGGTLYTLLVGETAFSTKPGEDLLVAISRIVRQPVPDLRLHGVPEPAVHVIERLLAKSPVDRYPSAAAAAAALQAAQRATGRPVTRAVVEGAPAADDATRTRPLRWRPGGFADEPEPGDQVQLTRPRYVPQDWAGRGTVAPAPDLVASIPAARTPIRSAAATGVRRPSAALPPTAPPPDTQVGPPDGPRAAEPADGSSPPRPRRRALAVGAAVLVVLGVAVAAGVLLGNRPAPAPPAGPASTAAPAPSTPAPTTTAARPLITVAGGVDHPDRDAVVARLDGYFQALNDRDYQAAFDAFSPDSAVVDNGLPAFRTGNSTTEVARQRILGIEDLDPGGLLVTVTYRSTQDAEYGVDGQTCTNWRLAYELTGPQLLIRRARAVTPPQAC
jgi:serine/threonine-protein kinase PknK